MPTLAKLRKKYPQFTYRSFSYQKSGQDLELKFDFSVAPEITFKHRLTIKNGGGNFSKLNKALLDQLVFHLGLVILLSYWKAFCSPEIFIACGSLTDRQLAWWHEFLLKGMGEFFYQNKIDFTAQDFVKLRSERTDFVSLFKLPVKEEQYLTFVGGGKDSPVAIETLKKLNLEQTPVTVNPTEAAKSIIKQAGFQDMIEVNFQMDQHLLDLNQHGYLNGHTPFSALLAFLGLILGVVFDANNLVVANERSAEEANIIYLDKKINHQYSKTLEFEKSFRNYVARFLVSGFNYFSLIRPLWEIQVSKVFASYPQYFKHFRSCNRGQKENRWCCQCPKCLSVYLLLYPFLGRKTITVFGSDLFTNKTLIDLLDHLSGRKQPKPFECVATKEEIIIALYLSCQKYRHDQLPPLLEYAFKEILPSEKNLALRAKRLMQQWGNDQFLTNPQIKLLKQLIHA